jgi:hypothetical protein
MPKQKVQNLVVDSETIRFPYHTQTVKTVAICHLAKDTNYKHTLETQNKKCY